MKHCSPSAMELDMNTLVATTNTPGASLEHNISLASPNQRSGEGAERIWSDLGGSPERPFYRFPADGLARNLFGSPVPLRTTLISVSRSPSHELGNNGGDSGRNLNGSPSTVGLQNTPPPGRRNQQRGRTTNTSLPSYYPTTPLQEIQRRRNRFRPTLQELNILVDTDVPINPEAPLEHDISLASIQIYTDDEFDDFIMAPQKKLLNTIDVVEKVFMRELHRIQCTSSFREAERKRKVRTLMSMR